MSNTSKSNGSTAGYYELPEGAKELYELINFKNMSGNVAEAFRSLYRLGESSHSDKIRDLNKAIVYCQYEKERIEKYETEPRRQKWEVPLDHPSADAKA